MKHFLTKPPSPIITLGIKSRARTSPAAAQDKPKLSPVNPPAIAPDHAPDQLQPLPLIQPDAPPAKNPTPAPIAIDIAILFAASLAPILSTCSTPFIMVELPGPANTLIGIIIRATAQSPIWNAALCPKSIASHAACAAGNTTIAVDIAETANVAKKPAPIAIPAAPAVIIVNAAIPTTAAAPITYPLL